MIIDDGRAGEPRRIDYWPGHRNVAWSRETYSRRPRVAGSITSASRHFTLFISLRARCRKIYTHSPGKLILRG